MSRLARVHNCEFQIIIYTLLPTQMFPCLPARATFVADTNFESGTQKMFLILFRNILYLQQMFPSLRSPRNIMGNNVSATMCPRLPGLLRSSENCTIAVAGRSGKINQRQCSTPGLAIGWFFRFCFRLRQPSFQDHKRRSRKQNRKKGQRSDYSDSAYDSDFRFSLGHKLFYDSDSVAASENQP